MNAGRDNMNVELEVVEPHVEFITPKYDPNWADNALRLIEECGRVSHKSEGRIAPGSAEPFVRKIAIQFGHESILEHVNFTVCFIGSRAMSHQLVRHRIAAYTQESQRYCDYADEGKHPRLKVIVPPSICKIDQGSRVSDSSMPNLTSFTSEARIFFRELLNAYENYVTLREAGVPAEDARHLLPNAAKTEVYTTFNLRQWRHFMTMRCDKHAQWEIRKCAWDVLNFFDLHLPLLLLGLETHSGEML